MTILKNPPLDLNGVGYELLKLFSWPDIGCLIKYISIL